MTINLGKKWQKKLALLPETSMGAQHVDILLRNGRVLRNVSVFNGEDAEVAEPFEVKDIQDIRLHNDGLSATDPATRRRSAA
jgi:hypothetical protein